MRYALLFLLLSATLIVLAIVAGGAALWLLWPAASFLLVGTAYLTARPSLLGKRTDGTLALSTLLPLAPYLLLTWGLWHLVRLCDGNPPAHEVAPGIWVGRRPFFHEIPAGVRLIVDLTAEFSATASIRRAAAHPTSALHPLDAPRLTYQCVPVLDGAAPSPEALLALLQRLHDQEGIYLHCASGSGRSAMVAAGLLLSRGGAADIDDAEAQLRARRRIVRLNAAQRTALRRALGSDAHCD
ncbi:dual specificity protein phosphatase family protein [Chondromyces apiculatus]|uniref:Tyrosine specific protein phosphatases domain-containing protein n=1 Tax=Chondromyces apiculatus DSM 436 TaxID=1192034 RepID=A0A017SYN9_9BACT|nr:dual specificity protein phosphatase family protein [Chondromyces apiculatus]EYF01426.1 Hypothetical protein CAP_8357 [Chondromyces apiculatus DSM 436]